MIIKDCSVKFSTESSTGDGYDATDKITSINLLYETELRDVTQVGSSFKQRKPTIKNWGAILNFNHDYRTEVYNPVTDLDDSPITDLAGGTITESVTEEITGQLWNLFGSSGAYITIKGLGGNARRFHGSFLLENFSPLSGSVGELAQGEINIWGVGKLTRDRRLLRYLVSHTTKYLVSQTTAYLITYLQE